MRKRYGRAGNAGPRRRISKRAVVVSVTLGVLAAGTGISLAATRNDAGAVTCIVVQDADAAADADSALSDVFAAGTGLHLVSAGRTVDVTVSGPITAAAATSAPPAAGAPAAGGREHRGRRGARSAQNAGQAQAVNAVAQVQRVSVKAADNDGVDPDTVCVKLSKNAFNTLGNVANGNNVGAFIATMTPKAANGNKGNGQNANGRNANGRNANGANANGANANGANANGANAKGRNASGGNANGKRNRSTKGGQANAGNGQADANNNRTRAAAAGDRNSGNRR